VGRRDEAEDVAVMIMKKAHIRSRAFEGDVAMSSLPAALSSTEKGEGSS